MTYRKDKLEVIDEEGNVLSIEERGRIHQEGLLHKEVHVWFYTPAGEIIFQHRAKDVEMYPDLLDATVGAHVEIGDSYIETALKEVEEETGLQLKEEDLDLLKMSRFTSFDEVAKKKNNSLKAVFTYRFEGDLSELRIEEGKSYGFEAHPFKTIYNPTEEERKLFVGILFQDEFQEIFKKIEKLYINDNKIL